MLGRAALVNGGVGGSWPVPPPRKNLNICSDFGGLWQYFSLVFWYTFVFLLFMAFVEDNGTMSSIQYFENHLSYFVQNRREVDPIELISQRQVFR